MRKKAITREKAVRTAVLPAVLAVVLAMALGAPQSGAQVLDSGSTGVDGELTFTETGTIDFEPAAFDPPLDEDGDGVYHFTTITIPSGVQLRLRADRLGSRPVIWLASGDVTVRGSLVLSGESGKAASSDLRGAATPGAGGYRGGLGSMDGEAEPTPGEGPGGGSPSDPATNTSGGGAGHRVAGTDGTGDVPGGEPYGNDFLVPLVGGSGGGGGWGGGGAGGGALLIASSTRIRIDGAIDARGGGGGRRSAFTSSQSGGGGGGSGGAIRLRTPTLAGDGQLLARGGSGPDGAGRASDGRIRLETSDLQFTGRADPVAEVAPASPIFPPSGAPSVRVVRVAGVDLPASPRAAFSPADVTIQESAAVEVEIEARNVPLSTTVSLTLFTTSGDKTTVPASSLSGSEELSTATASVTLPFGFTRFTVEADWTP